MPTDRKGAGVDHLFMWFMAVVVGSLLVIQWQLRGIAKNLKVGKGESHGDHPVVSK